MRKSNIFSNRYIKQFIINQLNMNRNMGILTYQKAIGHQKLLENDPKSDFFVLHEQKLYSFRKQFLMVSPYFVRNIKKNHRVHVIEQKINHKALDKVLGCFYGKQCAFQRNAQVINLMEVIKFLEFGQLEQKLKEEMIKNFRHYEIFTLLQFSHQYNDVEIQQKCLKELVKQDFEQMNFNRLQLLKCDHTIFLSLIKLHQKWKNSGKIKGLKIQDIRNIVEEYNNANGTNIDLITLLSQPSSTAIIQEQQDQKQYAEQEYMMKLTKSEDINPSRIKDSNSINSSQQIQEMKNCNISLKRKENQQQQNSNQEQQKAKSMDLLKQRFKSSVKFQGNGENKNSYLKSDCESLLDDLERTTSSKSQERPSYQMVQRFLQKVVNQDSNFLYGKEKDQSQKTSTEKNSYTQLEVTSLNDSTYEIYDSHEKSKLWLIKSQNISTPPFKIVPQWKKNDDF